MSGSIALVLRLAMVAALYGFLGYALYTLWSDLKLHGLQAPARPVTELRLLVDAPSMKVERRFTNPEVVIGRSPSCDVQLNEKSVSALHARLAFHHTQWWVEDLGSSNGTRLNSGLVSTPTVLTDGDEIRCGESTVRVRLETRDSPADERR